jgi:hypothetical protein
MGETKACGDGVPIFHGGMRVTAWAFVGCLLVHGGGAPGFSQADNPLTPERVSRGNAFHVAIAGTTNTQAVLTYSAPDGGACTVKVSQQSSLTPLVHDVDPNLFPGSDQDTRPESIAAQNSRVFVVGKRVTERAVDGRNYSRALEAYAIHYYQVTCGSVVWTDKFTTANIPFGMTYQDLPQLDPTNPGATITPTLLNDRTQTIVDPHTGALIRRISLPGDVPYVSGNAGTHGPFLYDSGFSRGCGNSLIGSSSPLGFLCSFAQGDGGLGVLYYIVPSTGEARHLGYNPWGASTPLINPVNSKFYVIHNGVDLLEKVYTGSYAAAAPGTPASFSSTTIFSGIPAAIHTFNPSYSTTDFTCGNPSADVSAGGIGDFIILSCRRGNQDTYGWVAVIRISTATLIAATRVDANIQCRWCAVHASFSMYEQGGVAITTHGFVAGNGIGGGPYVNTYAGTATLPPGSTTIAVSGEPSCAACAADSSVALAQAGDTFQFQDGTNDSVTILAKTSSTSWVTTATLYPHSPGAILYGACSYKPIFWKFLADPNGTDTTNTNFVADSYWPVGGHDDMTTNLRLTEHWQLVVGDLLASVNQPITKTISESPTFAGASAQCYGNGCVSHPSAGPPGASWLTDYFRWDGAFADAATLTPLSGQLYQYVHAAGYPKAQPKYFAIAAAVQATYTGGPFSLLDVSGPGVMLGTGSTDSYKLCIANAPGECYAGSSKGDEFINVPSLPSLSCWGASACLNNFNAYANGVLQIGTSGTQGRVISGGLTGLRNTNDYPTAKALGDGSYLLFAYGDVTHYPPSQMLMAKLPPFTRQDTVVRTTFVRSPISIAAPQGQRIASAAIEFGYTEQGQPDRYYCTSRRETCVAVSATVTDATPFYYAQTENYTRMPCAKSCTITLPVLPAHVAYYQVKFYDAQGVLVGPGDRGVSVEAAAVKPGGASANANQ